MKLFLDTNVLIDFIMERPLFYDAAAMIVSYAFEKKVSICVSTLSIVTANFICVERCKMPMDIFRRKIDFLRAFIEVCSVILLISITRMMQDGKILRMECSIILHYVRVQII